MVKGTKLLMNDYINNQFDIFQLEFYYHEHVFLGWISLYRGNLGCVFYVVLYEVFTLIHINAHTYF